jgi:sulfonate transport system ATP-binding protein
MATPLQYPMTSANGADTTGSREAASATDSVPAVHVRGLRKTFGTKVVLDGVDLDVARGEFVALLGASGTGKTTLLRILAGLELPDENQSVVLVPRLRTTVYQEPRLVPSMRVAANVAIGQRNSKETRAAAVRALAEVGLSSHARAWPATLSGGEAQRVALARALVREPQLLLLDEPFGALDALTRLQMQDLVADLCTEHRPAVVLVTHDVDEAIRLADRILILRHGRFVVNVRLDIPAPRDRNDARFLDQRRSLLAEMGVETRFGGRHVAKPRAPAS